MIRRKKVVAKYTQYISLQPLPFISTLYHISLAFIAHLGAQIQVHRRLRLR